MEKILIVEDDAGIADFVNAELLHEGYTTVLAGDGRTALEVFEKEHPDLILLDVMLPELSGLEFAKLLPKETRFVFTTAFSEYALEGYENDGLNAGADDYIPKPFEIEELLARMSAVLRRTASSSKQAVILTNRELCLNQDNMKVTLSGNELTLSKTEYMMLKHFLENPDKVMSRSQIIDAIWGEGHFIDENTIDVYVGYLRSKIDQASGEEYIKTVRGSGYMMIKG